METEAKFVVPDEATFSRLRQLTAIGPYAPRDTRTKHTHDRYLDTEDRSFFNRHLYVRLRQFSGGDLLLTIKGLGFGVREGSIHTRDEYETEVSDLDVARWPQGDVRRIVEETARGNPLRDLYSLDQTRTVSNLYRNGRALAELSVDEVIFHTAAEPVRA
ncbi:MAG TPA: CYTH domain-containing protein, partial [Chloroflexia bacterium]|nr:CYTH domain-containing protein [Chloroflexia bacterium]